jgi:hypothetical protein
MKGRIVKAGYLFCILILVVAACKKNNTGTIESYSDQINAMVDKSGATMDNQEVFTDDSTCTIYMLNDGISPEFLADESCLSDDPAKTFIRDHSFVKCLRGLSLSEKQVDAVKQCLRTYNACSEKAVKRAGIIYLELKEKYRGKYLRIYNAWQNGSITKKEFKQKLEELRLAFKQELRRMHLREKLDEALKQCLRECFKGLHGILSERQWDAFIACNNN